MSPDGITFERGGHYLPMAGPIGSSANPGDRLGEEIQIVRSIMHVLDWHEESLWLGVAAASGECGKPRAVEALRRAKTIAALWGYASVAKWIGGNIARSGAEEVADVRVTKVGGPPAAGPGEALAACLAAAVRGVIMKACLRG